MVIDTADQVRRIIGDDLPADAETVLDAGGVLDFTRATGNQRFEVIASAGKRVLSTPALPTLRVASLPIELTANFGGAVLLSTAEDLKLPVSEPKRYIYPDASQTVIANAAQAAVEAGYDSDFVQYAVDPPPPQLPANAYAFLAALVLGGFAILLNVIRGQGRRLRGYLARLVAIGLGTRWTLSVLAIQAALIVGVGLLAGVSAGVLGVQITADNYVVTAVPVLPITLACSATILAAVLATATAVRALTARENPEIT
jgi:putative ABC transport system permease protein